MRKSGILLPVSSLPSECGIGTLGKGAYDFVDFLHSARQHFWQVLPVNPTAYADSPYQSPSAFAGNPYFIDPLLLYEQGLLKKSEVSSLYNDAQRVDYAWLYRTRHALLERAAGRLSVGTDYEEFCAKNAHWLDAYALFTVLRSRRKIPLEQVMQMSQAGRDSAAHSFSAETDMFRRVQYLFFTQWFNLKKYANNNAVHIIGDIPIYVAYDSADVWHKPELFLLDASRRPCVQAGCPPDAFSKDGQLWGNPMYNWKKHAADGFSWWLSRLSAACETFDGVRIDHFRGFYSGYAVKAGADTAAHGEWIDAPKMQFVDCVRNNLPDAFIIAEDLGFVTPEVRRFFDESGFPGMKLMQFAFDGDELPHTFGKNNVAYTGTHDNPTVVGWLRCTPQKTLNRAMDYLGVERVSSLPQAMIKATLASNCDTAIIPMADWLKLGASGRINTPSTAHGNWTFRIGVDCLTAELAAEIKAASSLYARV